MILKEAVVNITYESFTAAPQDAVFTCNFEGDPQPDVSWFSSSGEMLQSTSKTLLSFFANSSTLQIVNVTVDDHGSYICNASNNHSSASKSGTLNVIGMLKIFKNLQLLLDETRSAFGNFCDRSRSKCMSSMLMMMFVNLV